MKIAFVLNDITTRGGIERVTSNLATLFSSKGLDVTIISLYRENTTPSFYIGKDVHITYLNHFSHIEYHNSMTKLIGFVKTTLKLKKYTCESKFDIIIGQATRSTLHCLFAGLRTNTITCEHFKYELYSGWKLKLRNWFYKKFPLITVLTENDSRKFREAGLRCQHIPNMVPYTIREEKSSNAFKTIVSLGRLHHQKGFDLLIKAMRVVVNTYPDWKLEIYGEGYEKDNLLSLIKYYKLLNNVKLMGYCENIETAFNHASFYALSSRYEGFPMCLLEAASFKLPIVSFNCPEGPSELLKNNAGLLVEPENIEKLAAGIVFMIENPEKGRLMAENALINLENYSPEKIFTRWQNAFEFVLKVSRKG